MAQLSSTLKDLRRLRDDLWEENKAKRNQILATYYNRLAPGVKDSIVFSHGNATYREKTFPQFIKLIDKRNIAWRVTYTGGDDNAMLAKAANEMLWLVESKAKRFMQSGKYLNSMALFMREIGDPQWQAITGGAVTERLLPDRAVVRLAATAEYSNTLEITKAGGVLYFIARQLRSRFGPTINVNYKYVGGGKMGYQGGSFPVIDIGFVGNLRRKRMVTPGRYSDRRRGGSPRRSRRTRGYAQVKMRSS